ncbi:P-loop containing nucleoside triphosphate hydrolase [Parasponia andersonii]|uniref:P-loop containing nucleoside triphosphate hydrolase n=1 Tax=Parasponia andersonii TaxID=3476 RepID=A0A2P5AG59_PARAD|nr:P-loop containing nucleoside triphosphate hydrolase [Parasponia andersonii]
MGVIIAMKGHPGTGKSSLAHSIASALKLPLLDKDDVRDSTLPVQRALEQLTSPGDPHAHASSLLNDLSYRAIWQIASTQLRLGLGGLVIDSPLSRRAHLDRLLDLASSNGARLVIVECKPSDQAEWRRRLERRGEARGGGAGWHKPATWRDIERLLDGYAGCTEYDVGGVPRIVVDTTASVGFEELVSSVVDFICSHAAPPLPPSDDLNCTSNCSEY